MLHTEHKDMDAKMNSFQGEGDISDLKCNFKCEA